MLEQLIPEPHFTETHRRDVAGTPHEAYDALRALTLAEMPLARALFMMRGLSGTRGLVADTTKPLLQQMAQRGFAALIDNPGREFAIGAISQPWRLRRAKVLPVTDVASFIEINDPGFVKMVMGFEFRTVGAHTRIETQTSVVATDAPSRRAFGRYWLLVRAGSGAIRRAMLRGVARRVRADVKSRR